MDFNVIFLLCALINCIIISGSMETEKLKSSMWDYKKIAKLQGDGIAENLDVLFNSILLDPVNKLLMYESKENTEQKRTLLQEDTEQSKLKTKHPGIATGNFNLKSFLAISRLDTEGKSSVDVSSPILRVSVNTKSKVKSKNETPIELSSEVSGDTTFDKYVNNLIKNRSKWLFDFSSHGNSDETSVNMSVNNTDISSNIDISLPVVSANIPLIEIPGYKALADNEREKFADELRDWIRSGQMLSFRVKGLTEIYSTQSPEKQSDSATDYEKTSIETQSSEDGFTPEWQNGLSEFSVSENQNEAVETDFETENIDFDLLEKRMGEYAEFYSDYPRLPQFSEDASDDLPGFREGKNTEDSSFHKDPEKETGRTSKLLKDIHPVPAEKNVILALTPTGFPLVIFLDKTTERPIFKLHDILLKHRLSMIVPTNPAFTIVGKQFAFLGNPDHWTGPLYLDMNEIAENADLIRAYSKLQHKITDSEYGDVRKEIQENKQRDFLEVDISPSERIIFTKKQVTPVEIGKKLDGKKTYLESFPIPTDS